MTRTDKFLIWAANRWMDFKDGLTDNPSAMLFAFVIGLIVCSVLALVI